MIAALLLAVAAGAPLQGACDPGVRAARIHLVDGMPFVDAVIRTVRIVRAPARTAQVFRVFDGRDPIGELTFAPDGSVEVRGAVKSDPAGRFVDVYAKPNGCPRVAARSVMLRVDTTAR